MSNNEGGGVAYGGSGSALTIVEAFPEYFVGIRSSSLHQLQLMYQYLQYEMFVLALFSYVHCTTTAAMVRPYRGSGEHTM